MQVTETHAEGLTREFKVVISASDIDEKLLARLEELGRSVRIPGFRPGKVPPGVLKKRFGSSVLGEVLERSVNDSSRQAIAERGLRPALQPSIEITSFDQGKDLEYKLKIELMPDFEPADLSNLALERVKVEVPDAEVEEALGRLAQQQRKTKPLETDRPAESGDVVVIDFRGTVEGEPFPGMEGQDHHLELGSNSFIAGFEDQLIGKSKGDEIEVKVTFPEQYDNEKLAGKEAVFQVTLKDILATEPTPLDDEMAKTYGAESLEELRGRVREHLGKEYEQLARSKLKRELLDKLAETHDFPVPAGMVDIEFETIWQQVQTDRQAGRIDPDDEGKDEEQLKAEYRTIAERRVRLGLLLSEIGRRNQIEVGQEELNRALFEEARRHPGHERQVVDFYQKNPQALGQLRGPIFEDKVIDFIANLAQLEERRMSPEELRQSLESDAGAAEEKAAAASGSAETKPKGKQRKTSRAKKGG